MIAEGAPQGIPALLRPGPRRATRVSKRRWASQSNWRRYQVTAVLTDDAPAKINEPPAPLVGNRVDCFGFLGWGRSDDGVR
jgi:hypothetical protein